MQIDRIDIIFEITMIKQDHLNKGVHWNNNEITINGSTLEE